MVGSIGVHARSKMGFAMLIDRITVFIKGVIIWAFLSIGGLTLLALVVVPLFIAGHFIVKYW